MAVVDALNELAAGATYAQTSLDLRQRTKLAREHQVTHGKATPTSTEPSATSGAATGQEGRSAWHLAADLVEQYSPVLYASVEAGIREREQSQRATNDALLADGVIPEQPSLMS